MSVMKPTKTTIEFTLAEVRKLIASDLGVDPASIEVNYKTQQVTNQPVVIGVEVITK